MTMWLTWTVAALAIAALVSIAIILALILARLRTYFYAPRYWSYTGPLRTLLEQLAHELRDAEINPERRDLLYSLVNRASDEILYFTGPGTRMPEPAYRKCDRCGSWKI
jgi:hypothetical protein